METLKILLAAWSPLILWMVGLMFGYDPLEYFKGKAKNKADKEDTRLITKIQEAVKSEFAISHTKFSYLHQRRIQVIEEMYKRLLYLQGATAEMTRKWQRVYNDADKEQQGRVSAFTHAFNKYKRYALIKEIFFETDLNTALKGLITKYWDNAYDFGELERYKSWGVKPKDDPELFKQAWEKVNAASDKIADEMPGEIEAIKLQFQELIGMLKQEEK